MEELCFLRGPCLDVSLISYVLESLKRGLEPEAEK
jgi:hypothetical protein